MPRISRGAAVLLIASGAATAAAQPHPGVPNRLHVLSTRGYLSSDLWTNQGLLAPLGDRVVLMADDGWTRGRELWISDGTAEGTRLLKNLDPRTTFDINPTAVMPFVNGGTPKAAFMGSDERGRLIAITDGTEEGTTVSAAPAAFGAALLGAVGGGVLQIAWPGSGRGELWIADGAVESRRLAQFASYSYTGPMWIGSMGDRGYFWPSPFIQLWTTDGTEAGTRPIAGSPDAGTIDRPGVAISGGRLFTVCRNRTNGLLGIYVVDLSTEAVSMVVLPSGASVFETSEVIPLPDGSVLVTGRLAGTNGLLRTDGTTEGTTMFLPGVTCSVGRNDARHVLGTADGPAGRRVLFFANSPGQGEEIWATDGTPEGTGSLGDLTPGSGSRSPTVLGSTPGGLWFSGPGALPIWFTDGTPEGTRPVSATARRQSGPGLQGPYAAAMGDRLVLALQSDNEAIVSLGLEGDERTIRPPQDAVHPYDSRITAPVRLGSELAFIDWQSGREYGVYLTDGTTAGTRRAVDLPAGETWKGLSGAGGLAWLWSDTSGASTSRIWRTDGTPEGTFEVGVVERSPIDGFVSGGAGVVFCSTHLYTCTGAAGSIRRISVGSATSTQFAAAPGGLVYHKYWNAFVPTIGVTDASTGVVTPLLAMSNLNLDQLTHEFRSVGSRGFFVVRHNGAGPNSTEVWCTEGTAASTRMVLDLSASVQQPAPARLATCGRRVLVPQRDSATSDWLLQSIDADSLTATVIGRFDRVAEMSPFGDRAVLLADDGVHGVEAWITDGTAEGTRMITETAPGPYGVRTSAFRYASPTPTPELRVVGDRAYFSVATPDLATHPWVTDGTAEGTHRLGAAPEDDARVPMAGVGYAETPGAVVFGAWTPATGTQLFSVRFCDADFNADGMLDAFDLMGFADAFTAGTPDADFNGDGFVDFFDCGGFVDAFERGC